MKLTTGRSVKYLFLTHIASLILIVLYCHFLQPGLALAVLVPPYLLISILVLYSRLFLPITAGTFFILLILTDKSTGSRKEPRSGESLVFTMFSASIPSAMIYFMLVFFAEPGLIEKKEWLEELSKSGSFYIKEAARNFEAGRLEEALSFADLYLYIDPENKTAVDIKNDIKIALPGSGKSEESKDPGFYRNISEDFLTGEKLFRIAENYYKKGDFSSAVYYGQMAGHFRSSKSKALKLVRSASEKLSGYTPDKSREERLYDGKVEITGLITGGDFHNAYYKFHQLSGEFSRDTELASLGEKLFSLLSDISFFYEEIREYYFAPGKTGIAFVNRSEKSEKELILAEKIVYSGESVYFFDIDIIRFSDAGKITGHLHSLYGKAIGDTLNMRCIGKESRLLFLPDIITGTDSDDISSVKLNIPYEALLYTGKEDTRLEKIKTPFLAENLSMLSSIGAGKNTPAETLFLRFIRFFNFIIVLLAVMAAGISFLKRSRGKSYTSLLILPFVVFSVYLLENSIIYLKGGIISIFIGEAGIVRAGILYAVITLAETAGILVFTVKKAASLLREE